MSARIGVKLPPLSLPTGEDRGSPGTPRYVRHGSRDAIHQIGRASLDSAPGASHAAAAAAASAPESPARSGAITPKRSRRVTPPKPMPIEGELLTVLKRQRGLLSRRTSQEELAQAIQIYILGLMPRSSPSDQIDAIALLKCIREGREIPTLCFKDPDEVVRAYHPGAPVSLETIYPLFADANQELDVTSEKVQAVFCRFKKKQRSLVFKELDRWAHPQVERPRHWDERDSDSLPKDLNDRLPKPLAEAQFVDLIRSGLYHQRVTFRAASGDAQALDLSLFTNFEDWGQQTAFLTQFAQTLVAHGFLESPAEIPFQIAQMRWVHQTSRGLMNETPPQELADRVKNELRPLLGSGQEPKIDQFIGMLWILQGLAIAQPDSDGLASALNTAIKTIFHLNPNPLLKALIPFNIGSYSSFHQLIKQTIPLTLKIDQKEGMTLQILSVGELQADIPQNYKIMSKDGTRLLGSLQTEMRLESAGAQWHGTLTIKGAILFKEATSQEKMEILHILA